MDMISRSFYGLILFVLLSQFTVLGQDPQTEFLLENNEIRCMIGENGMISLTDPSDTYHADIVGRSHWCRTKLIYRTGEGSWLDIFRDSIQTISGNDSLVSILLDGDELKYEQRYSLTGNGIDLSLLIESKAASPVTIGDLALYFPWRRASGQDPEYIFEQCFIKHHFISGDGSFLIFTKPSGKPPFLMVLTRKGTKLEYFDDKPRDYKVYIHSGFTGNNVELGTWRQEHTRLSLGPAGSGNSRVEYGLKLRWADSWDEMRQILYEEDLFDIRVVPGMTVPNDLKAQFSLHTRNSIDSITAEFPDKTEIVMLGEKLPGHFLYEVSFNKLGENMLTVHYGDGLETYLEFFSTESLETLIKKRASFIVNSQQHRDTAKWYNGLFSVYDMKNGVLRGPDNTDGFDGWYGYVLACDDPALCKAPFLAAKNVYYPDDKEIEAVEYYLENFVWDGLQRTDKNDPYPYGIYGVPNWKVARDSVERAKISNRNLDKMKIWRSYDYPHIIMLYYHMYQIARMYPKRVRYLDAERYLERAYQTSRAYFLYPYEILPWYDTYKWGCYNELIIEKLMADLEKEGRTNEADWLRNEYEKKVKYFIYDDKYPYRSEYAIDRTAFESSYAFAKYGTLNKMKPDSNLWYDKNVGVWRSHSVVRQEDARLFMDRQHYAGLAVRGWLETSYNLLGADFTHGSDNHGLSYMAKMGGWSILDYGIHFADNPYDWLQLGYASYLSSWALMNTGTAETDYGFWSPGKQNDGAMGWTFMYPKWGTTKTTWLRKDRERGAWIYDGEADLGNGAAIRMARTVLTDDPLFGWIAYGGTLSEIREGFSIVPRDGLRARFSLVTEKQRFSMELNRDGFVNNSEIFIDNSLMKIRFRLENRSADTHETQLRIETRHKNVKVFLDGKPQKLTEMRDRESVVDLSISEAVHEIEIALE